MVYLIDGNAYINVAVSVTKSILSRDKSIGRDYYIDDIFSENKKILREQCRITFRDFCLSYLVSLIAPIHKEVDEVHIVFDSKSWRKKYISDFFTTENVLLDRPSDIKEFEYKANRRGDSNIYLFFEYFQGIVLDHLKNECGINFHRWSGMEGDDILAYLCDTFTKDTIIYSVDKDLIQLVNNSGLTYTIMVSPKQMSKHKKLYVSDYSSELNESDFFNIDNVTVGNLNNVSSKLIEKGYVKYPINSTRSVLEKIIGGDKSDKIPRLYKMTKSKVNKVCELIIEKYGNDILHKLDELNAEFIDYAICKISKCNKLEEKKDIDTLRKHFIFNTKIIRLSHTLLPLELKNEIETRLNLLQKTKYNNFKYSKLLELKNKSVLL
jgi:5'-3' exonuclease